MRAAEQKSFIGITKNDLEVSVGFRSIAVQYSDGDALPRLAAAKSQPLTNVTITLHVSVYSTTNETSRYRILYIFV